MIVYLKVLIAALRLLKMTGPLAGEFKIVRVYEQDNHVFFDLPLNSATRAPGLSSLFWDSRNGHALVERVEEHNSSRAKFQLKTLYSGKLPKAGKLVWLSGWLGNHPSHFDLEKSVKEVRLPNGVLAWVSQQPNDKWVIHVHGRRAQMGETLRNFAQFSELGYSQLTISMATDPKPYGLGVSKSTLGETEWLEIEQAIEFAKRAGAKEIILFGWSQGAMISGNYLKRASNVSIIKGVIFDSPLLDYRETMRLHAKKQGFGIEAGDRVIDAIASSKALRLLGYTNVDSDDLSLVRKELPTNVPMLVLYSGSDNYVAIDEVHKLPQLNNRVTLVEIPDASHCRLYNLDTRKYQESIAAWLSEHQI